MQARAAADRGTSRRINRQLALNLIRMRQPLSRADLARHMGTRRGAVTEIVTSLIREGLVYEGAKGDAPRGRKPRFLFIDSRQRCVAAVDMRPTRTQLMLTDLGGQPLHDAISFPTSSDPPVFVRELSDRIRALVAGQQPHRDCQGVGVVVPGMVDRSGQVVVFAPRLGWRDVPLRDPLAAATGLPVRIENSGKAGALAQMWLSRGHEQPPENFVFLSVSDGLGVGVVVQGELLRGRHNIAGEFGHFTIAVDGPGCACGARGCLEAHVSNLATLARYFGRTPNGARPDPYAPPSLTMDDLVARARSGDVRASAALEATARFLGIGLAGLVNAVDPERFYLSGEIVGAWDLVEQPLRAALEERVLRPASSDIEIRLLPPAEQPRLRGAAALVISAKYTEAAAA